MGRSAGSYTSPAPKIHWDESKSPPSFAKSAKEGWGTRTFSSRLLSEMTGLLKRYDGEYGVRDE